MAEITKYDSRFEVMLDAGDSDFAEQLAQALGLKEGERLKIMTPQFDRTDGRQITYFPHTFEEYAALPTFSENTLRKLGCQKWSEPDEEGNVLWLFPHEWYRFIPAGLEVTDICGGTESFFPGTTDNDIRFGALAYGFVAKAQEQ